MSDGIDSEISNTPLNFTLNQEESSYAWERARIFFREHYKGGLISATGKREMTLTPSPHYDKKLPRVRRVSKINGEEFSIECDQNRAVFECKNLASFVKSGLQQK